MRLNSVSTLWRKLDIRDGHFLFDRMRDYYGLVSLFVGTLGEHERYHPWSTFRQAAARVTSLVVSR